MKNLIRKMNVVAVIALVNTIAYGAGLFVFLYFFGGE